MADDLRGETCARDDVAENKQDDLSPSSEQQRSGHDCKTPDQMFM